MLPPEAIKEFQELYRVHFGEEIDEGEAERRAEKFLQLFKAVYLPQAGMLLPNPQIRDSANLLRFETGSNPKETEEQF